MTWDPRAFLNGGGGFQPGGIMGGPGQGGPAAGGGMPSLQDFWSRVQGAGGQVRDGMRNARMDFRDNLVSRLGQMPSMMGMQPRPGGTAGGGWQFPQGHFQMPPGFASRMPWGQGAAAGGGPGAMGAGAPNGIAEGEPNGQGAAPRGSPMWQMHNARPMSGGGGDASQGSSQSRGNYVPKDPAAAAETKRKAEEIGKKAKGY